MQWMMLQERRFGGQLLRQFAFAGQWILADLDKKQGERGFNQIRRKGEVGRSRQRPQNGMRFYFGIQYWEGCGFKPACAAINLPDSCGMNRLLFYLPRRVL